MTSLSEFTLSDHPAKSAILAPFTNITGWVPARIGTLLLQNVITIVSIESSHTSTLVHLFVPFHDVTSLVDPT